jgi:folate-dependent tRNA-U54 methylase TrmFO/GidA
MTIDMVDASLRLVCRDENGGRSPQRAVRYLIYEAADREVVISNHGRRCRKTGGGAIGVIFRHGHHHQVGHVAVSHPLLEVGEEDIRSDLFGNLKIEAGITPLCKY